MDSIWYNSVPEIIDEHKSINSNISCDVAIIGGGLTGITCAYYLNKIGLRTVILEKDFLMSKTSGHTTAKITAQHGLFYKYLIDNFGFENAKKYLNSNLNAIKNIKKIIDSENISCSFEYQNSYVFTRSNSYITSIKEEISALKALNYNANFINKIPLPINNVLCAIQFPGQAQFHPRKYARALCNALKNNHCLIFENSKVRDIKRKNDLFNIGVNNCYVNAKNVILATRYPFINFPGFYFIKLYQSISYCSCYEISNNIFNGFFINAEKPTLSARIVKDNNKTFLLLSGCDHRVGKSPSVSNPYSTLETIAHSIDSNAKLISKWVTEDSVSLDKLPYIGNFSSFIPNMYVATGFKKWGMTFSNISANIIVDNILGRKNIYSNLFNSTRFHPIKNKNEMKNMIKESTSSLILKKFNHPNDSIINISKNEGKIITTSGKTIGVYKDFDGKTYKIEPKCKHLGCELSWNPTTKSWDCPCHGSRFDYTGNLLYGPSQSDLNKL